MSWIEGKKTYITCALMFIIAGLHAIRSSIPVLSTISDDVWQKIMEFVSTGGIFAALAFLRMGKK